MDTDDLLSTGAAAELLGISSASVRNWERHGYLHNLNGSYDRKEVFQLLEKIRDGEIKRLGRRANKREKNGTIKPATEFGDIYKSLAKLSLSADKVMFLLSLRLLTDTGEISELPANEISSFDPSNYKRPAVLELIKKRYLELFPHSQTVTEDITEAHDFVATLALPSSSPAESDLAGNIYQALRSSGNRSRSGSFYTPPRTAESMVHSALKKITASGTDVSDARMIDPCCGTGQFLLSFINAGGQAENVVGMDSDPTAAFCSAVNIFLQCPDLTTVPKIITADSLLASRDSCPIMEGFDLAITNPPWGAATASSGPRLKALFPAVKSGESFSYFIIRCFELVRSGGIVSVVLPESVTNVKRHRDIREFILANSRICDITARGKLFRDVYTPVITIEMQKVDSPPKTPGNIHIGPDLSFNININSTDSRIIDSLYSLPHLTLKDNADWALGIVTGDNERFLTDHQGPGHEAVIRGSDIMPGNIMRPGQYIKFDPDLFQQIAPEWKYRENPKIVYRFISKRLVFSPDTLCRLTLNSANILIPGNTLLKAGFSCETLSSLFNSDLYNYVYSKLFNTIKVLRGNLEKLPLPYSMPGTEPEKLPEVLGLSDIEIAHIKNTSF